MTERLGFFERMRMRLEPSPGPCPDCGQETIVKKTMRISGWFFLKCTNPGCYWFRPWQPPPLI